MHDVNTQQTQCALTLRRFCCRCICARARSVASSNHSTAAQEQDRHYQSVDFIHLVSFLSKEVKGGLVLINLSCSKRNPTTAPDFNQRGKGWEGKEGGRKEGEQI